MNSFDERLYHQLISYPSEVLACFDFALNSFAEEELGDLFDGTQGEQLLARPFHLLKVQSMRNMNPVDIDTLVAIRGMVVRSTATIPDISEAFFRCVLCKHEEIVSIDMGRIAAPSKCTNPECQGTGTMQLEHNRSKFVDKQLVKVQETPENIPDGETPQTIDVYCYATMVDICRPGDRVEITGVYRATPIRPNPRRRQMEAVYKTFIDSVHIQKTRSSQFSMEDPSAEETSDFHTSFDETDLAREELERRNEQLIELAEDPHIYERLTRSFAPSIWEMEDVKKGILCQLFGGRDKYLGEKGETRFRSQMNVLLWYACLPSFFNDFYTRTPCILSIAETLGPLNRNYCNTCIK